MNNEIITLSNGVKAPQPSAMGNYGDSSFFPVFGGKLKGYSRNPGTEEI